MTAYVRETGEGWHNDSVRAGDRQGWHNDSVRAGDNCRLNIVFLKVTHVNPLRIRTFPIVSYIRMYIL